MNTKNLSVLKIHKLSQAKYDEIVAAGKIDEDAIYLTQNIGNMTKAVYDKDDDGVVDRAEILAATKDDTGVNEGNRTKPVYFNGGVPVEIDYTIEASVPSGAVFTDTHYESKNVIGSSSAATSNTNTSLANGSVYLNSVENNNVTSSHIISGAGATEVTSDESGNIIISSTNFEAATESADGLMSRTDKEKLDGIEAGANNTIIIDNLESDSTTAALSAAQGKVLKLTINAYDTNGDGIVDNSEKLDGHQASYFATQQDLEDLERYIVDGDIIPLEAEWANNAIKAKQDFAGNVITDTYETKVDAQTRYDEYKTYTDSYMYSSDNSYGILNTDEYMRGSLVSTAPVSKPTPIRIFAGYNPPTLKTDILSAQCRVDASGSINASFTFELTDVGTDYEITQITSSNMTSSLSIGEPEFSYSGNVITVIATGGCEGDVPTIEVAFKYKPTIKYADYSNFTLLKDGSLFAKTISVDNVSTDVSFSKGISVYDSISAANGGIKLETYKLGDGDNTKYRHILVQDSDKCLCEYGASNIFWYNSEEEDIGNITAKSDYMELSGQWRISGLCVGITDSNDKYFPKVGSVGDEEPNPHVVGTTGNTKYVNLDSYIRSLEDFKDDIIAALAKNNIYL